MQGVVVLLGGVRGSGKHELTSLLIAGNGNDNDDDAAFSVIQILTIVAIMS